MKKFFVMMFVLVCTTLKFQASQPDQSKLDQFRNDQLTLGFLASSIGFQPSDFCNHSDAEIQKKYKGRSPGVVTQILNFRKTESGIYFKNQLLREAEYFATQATNSSANSEDV